MIRTPEKSHSEADLTKCIDSSPTGFINKRNKRKRTEDASNINSDLTNFKKEIKDMLTIFMSQQRSETQLITTSLKTIETSLSFLSEQYEVLRKNNEELQKEVNKDKEYIILLENKIEDLQKSTYKCTLELKNVPITEKETKSSLISMTTSLSSALDVNLNTNDIKDIYRISTKSEKKPIIIELSSYILKANLMAAAKKYNMQNKNSMLNTNLLGMKCSTPIFLADHLTPKGNRLFFLARELARTEKYKFCWTSFGNVFIRKDENSRIIKLLNEAHIERLRVNIKHNN